MKKHSIIKMIKEEIQKRISDLDESPGDSFMDFRKFLAELLESVEAPDAFVDAVGNIELEGTNIHHILYGYWSDIDSDKNTLEDEFRWPRDAIENIEAALIDSASSFANEMNYSEEETEYLRDMISDAVSSL